MLAYEKYETMNQFSRKINSVAHAKEGYTSKISTFLKNSSANMFLLNL